MAEADATRWDERYRSEGWTSEPSEFLVSLDDIVPRAGRALDVAGGTGRNAVWLARRGLATTIADISPVALQMAAEAATAAGVAVELLHLDLEREPLPSGPWNVVLCFHYLSRSLFPKMADALAPGGLLVFAIATRKNLERHDRPGPEHVLDEGEAPRLAAGLQIVRYQESWTADDRHEARVVAVRPA